MSTHDDPLQRALVTGLDRLQTAMSETINRPLVPADATKKRPAPVQGLDSGFSLSAPGQLTGAQISDYLKHGGVYCPDCESEDITGSQIDVDAGCCWQNVTCNACGAEWTDEYELTTVTNFKVGVKSTAEVTPIDKH